MDVVTDQKIQKAIRESFWAKTLIIIAHRRETLNTCDSIVTIDDGVVAHIYRRTYPTVTVLLKSLINLFPVRPLLQ